MPLFRVIEKRVSYGEALIEADSFEDATEKAQTYSEENYEDFEWSDDGRISYEVRAVPE